MIPILYNVDETNFNHRGLGALNGLLEYKVTEELNGQFDAVFEYPVAGDMYQSIEDFMLIKAVPNRHDEPHVFRIYETELDIERQTLMIYARSNIYDLAGNMVRHTGVKDMTPTEAWQNAVSASIEPVDVTFDSTITTPSSTTWTRRNLLSCIVGEQGSMLQIWGGELKYGNKKIWLYRRRGDDNVTTIRYGKNLAGLKATYSTKGVVTAILPYFNYRGDKSGEEKVITGNVVKSDLVNSYPYVLYEAVEYNEDDGVTDLESLNRVAGQYFKDHPDKDKPSINMEVNMLDLSHTKEYEKFKDLEQVKLGDTVTVYAKKFGVNITAKVNKITYNGLTEENEVIEIGATRASQYDNYRELIDRTVDKTIRPIKEQLNIVQISASGKNRVFRGPSEPTEGMVEGDLWFKELGEGKRELYIYNGWTWGDPIDFDEASRKVAHLEEQLEKYSKDLTTTTELANNVSEKASQLEQNYQDVKASTESAMNKAVDAYTDAQSALAGLQTIGSENIVPPFTSDRWYFIGSATEGVDYKVSFDTFEVLTSRNPVYEVILDVEPNTDYVFNSNTDYMRWYIYDENKGILISNGRGGVEDEVVVFNTEDNEQIVLRIDTWSSMLSNVPRKTWKTSIKKGTVSTGYSPHYASVNEDISNAWNQAHQALENIDTLDQSVRLEFESIDGRLSSKAEQTTVNEINRTVQNQGSELLQAQNMIELKADKTDIDTLNEIIETNSAELSVLAGEISAKADKMIVDELNQSVENLSAEQIIQAGLISERLTRSEVNAEIERRVNEMAGGEFNLEGYAQVDYVENLIENTADSFSQSIESVRKLVPTDYENRNLVEDSREFNQPSSLTYLHRAIITEVNDKVNVGDTVTISFDVTADDDIPVFRFYDSNGSVDKNIGTKYFNGVIKKGTHRYSATVDVSSGGRGTEDWILDFYNQNDGTYFEIDNLKIEKGTIATDWSPAPEDLQNEVTILRSDYERTAGEVTDRLTKIDGNNGYINEIRRDVGNLTSSITEYEEGTAKRFNLIESDVRSNKSLIADLEKDTESRFLRTDQEMSLLVRSSDLISEINLQADRQIFRVGDNRLMITEDTTYLDNSVIKSAHIADLAVTGAKIAEASISSGKMISLDVNKLTGQTATLLQALFPNMNTQTTIDDRGINIVGNDRWRRSYFNQVGVEFFNGSGAYNKAGVIGYFKPSLDSADWDENVMLSTREGTPRHLLGIGVNSTHDLALGFNKWTSTNRIFSPALEIRGDVGDVRIVTELQMNNNVIKGISTARFTQVNTEIGTWDGSITYRANRHHRFFSSNNQELFNIQDNGYANLYARLNMQGNDVYNQSDERLKRNIMPSFKDSLGKFSKLEFKWFEYLENRGLADGLHHGVIAQDVLKFAPEWVVEDEQGYYSLNQSAMLMDAFKAIMQLSKKVKKLEEK